MAVVTGGQSHFVLIVIAFVGYNYARRTECVVKFNCRCMQKNVIELSLVMRTRVAGHPPAIGSSSTSNTSKTTLWFSAEIFKCYSHGCQYLKEFHYVESIQKMESSRAKIDAISVAASRRSASYCVQLRNAATFTVKYKRKDEAWRHIAYHNHN